MAMERNGVNQTQSFSFDSLYCEEEEWGEVENDDTEINKNVALVLNEDDLFWDNEELLSLFCKENETQMESPSVFEKDPSLSAARKVSVEWILKVNARYGFSTLTAILAINYLDRFLSSHHYHKDKPWLVHLASISSLSLAAKVEEIHVPLLLDLQVMEESEYLFEAKTVQKMELLMLSILKWRMNSVTPLSYVDHIIRRLALKNHLQCDFLRRCESLLLCVVADCRSVLYLPSVLAAAIMLHVIHEVDSCNAIGYQNQLLEVLKISKMEVIKECYELIAATNSRKKRKCYPIPSGVIDAILGSLDSSIYSSSWTMMDEPLILKKSRIQEHQIRLPSLSLTSTFVHVPGSPL